MENVKALHSGGYALPKDRVAPDLSRYRRSRQRYNHPYEQAKSQTAVRTAARAHAARRAQGMRLSLTTVLLTMLAFASVLFIVYTYMQLSELSKETSRLQKDLSAIRRENVQMQSQADNHLNLSELALAAEEMGMVLPEQEDVVYLDLSGSDHAVITEKPGVWDALVNAMASLSAKVHEYFA